MRGLIQELKVEQIFAPTSEFLHVDRTSSRNNNRHPFELDRPPFIPRRFVRWRDQHDLQWKLM